jgi:hypothetical protein
VTKVLVSDHRKSTLLVAIARRFGGLHVEGRTYFDFDKTQPIFVSANQVDFPAPPRRTKIARHPYIAQAPQIEVSCFLPTPPGPVMHGNILGRKRPLRHPVQRPNRRLSDNLQSFKSQNAGQIRFGDALNGAMESTRMKEENMKTISKKFAGNFLSTRLSQLVVCASLECASTLTLAQARHLDTTFAPSRFPPAEWGHGRGGASRK